MGLTMNGQKFELKEDARELSLCINQAPKVDKISVKTGEFPEKEVALCYQDLGIFLTSEQVAQRVRYFGTVGLETCIYLHFESEIGETFIAHVSVQVEIGWEKIFKPFCKQKTEHDLNWRK